MDLALLVYIISLLGAIAPVLGVTITFTIFAIVVAMIYRFAALNIETWDSENTANRKLKMRVPLEKWIKRLFGILFATTVLIVAIPSEKTAYMMVGAYATQKISEDEKVQVMYGKVLKIIEHKLDTYIEDGVNSTADKLKNSAK